MYVRLESLCHDFAFVSLQWRMVLFNYVIPYLFYWSYMIGSDITYHACQRAFV